MKNFPVKAELSHEDGQTKEQRDMIMIKVALGSFANHINLECKVNKIFNRI